jgi:hypothetical protein
MKQSMEGVVIRKQRKEIERLTAHLKQIVNASGYEDLDDYYQFVDASARKALGPAIKPEGSWCAICKKMAFPCCDLPECSATNGGAE